MKTNHQNRLLALMLSTLASGVLLAGGLPCLARAADGAPGANTPAGTLKKIPARANNQVSLSETLLPANKGVHPFNLVDNTATLVLDEAGAAPAAGQLVSVAISSSATTGGCQFQVFEGSSTSGITSASYSVEVGVPLYSVSSAAVTVTYSPPIQFQTGLVGLMTGACQLSELTWSRIGGPQ